jgi:hypothetical protein
MAQLVHDSHGIGKPIFIGRGFVKYRLHKNESETRPELLRIRHKLKAEPNKAMQPTPVAVTPRADARAAPATSVADLDVRQRQK